jgi:hypothetical protein
MLKALILENFKAFGGRRVIPIKPITLIFGPNSAGKSAILQSLLMLKQTITDPDTGDVPIRLKGSLVDLGSFREMVYRHETDRNCEVTPILSIDSIASEAMPSATQFFKANAQLDDSYGVGVVLSQARTGTQLRLSSLPMYVGNHDEPIARIRSSQRALIEIRKFLANTSVENSSLSEPDGLGRLVSPVTNGDHILWEDVFKKFVECDIPRLDELRHETGNLEADYELSHYNSPEFLPDREFIQNEIDQLLGLELKSYLFSLNIEAVYRSLRLRGFLLEDPMTRGRPATRKYQDQLPMLDSSTEINRRRFLEFLFDVGLGDGRGRLPSLADMALEFSAGLYQLVEELIYIGPLREFPERHYLFSGASPTNVGVFGQLAPDLLLSQPNLKRKINKALDRFDIRYQLEVQQLKARGSTNSDVYSLKLVDKVSSVRVSLRDVGFGISQVLPVLVQAIVAREDTLLIEQPELHLHPRLQAELADVFIEASLKRNNTFLIETHSEHLLLRIMRRLRDTSRGTLPRGIPELRPEHVSIIYVHPMEDGSGSVPLVMDLDEDGELLTAWPNGFFEEGFRERFA